MIAFIKNLEGFTIGNFNGGQIKNMIFNKELKRFEVLNYFDGIKHFEDFKYLVKLEELCVPNVNNEDLLKLNNHPSLKVLKVKTLYQDQITFINENKLSFKIEEVYHGDR